MNSVLKERAAETAAAAALIALLSAAVALGAMVLDRVEADRVYARFSTMARGVLVPAGTELVGTPLSLHREMPVRSAFRLSTREGRVAGTGIAVIVEGSYWSAELLVLTDERGRIRTSALRDGTSGVHGEELAVYLRRLELNSSGGLGPSADLRGLEYAVKTAMEAAVRIARDGKEAAR